MKHQIIQKLQEYTPSNEHEKQCKKHMLTFITEHDNCFERSLQKGHITASVWLVNHDATRALLMHHTKLGRWLQLGGHCDGETDVMAVALKEAQQESGISSIAPVSNVIFDIDIHRIPACKREPEHYHYDIRFLMCVTKDVSAVGNSESKELCWVTKERASLPTDNPSVVRMFEKWCTL